MLLPSYQMSCSYSPFGSEGVFWPPGDQSITNGSESFNEPVSVAKLKVIWQSKSLMSLA